MKDNFYETDPSLGKDINKMDVEELITLRESLKLYQFNKTEHLKDKLNKKSKLSTIFKGMDAVLSLGATTLILALKLFSSELVLLATIAGVNGIFTGITFIRDIKYRLAYKNAIKEADADCTNKIENINEIISKNFSNYKYKADAINIADQVTKSMKENETKMQREKPSKRLFNHKTIEKSQNDNEMIR